MLEPFVASRTGTDRGDRPLPGVLVGYLPSLAWCSGQARVVVLVSRLPLMHHHSAQMVTALIAAVPLPTCALSMLHERGCCSPIPTRPPVCDTSRCSRRTRQLLVMCWYEPALW